MAIRPRQALLVAGLVVVSILYFHIEKRVTLDVDGSRVQVSTAATTVGELVSRRGLIHHARDLVRPSHQTHLRDGQTVVVRHAKPVAILLNGTARQVWVTALTVEGALAELGLNRDGQAFTHPSRSTRVGPDAVLTVRESAGISVAHDGKTERVITNAATVKDVLAGLKIVPDPMDEVLPGLDFYPTAGMNIRVVRVVVKTQVERTEVPFLVRVQTDPNLEMGLVRKQGGRKGLLERTYEIRFADGKEVGRTLVAEKRVSEPQDQVAFRGTGQPTCRCNRGHQEGKATWYGARGLTAAHRTLPFGTVVRVTNLNNGRTVNVIIRDRGPWGGGRVIDLSDTAFAHIASTSTGIVPVRLDW
ncbi:MAG: ubiquitin-like domain-containing protein [Actinomycetota bacterium]